MQEHNQRERMVEKTSKLSVNLDVGLNTISPLGFSIALRKKMISLIFYLLLHLYR